MHSRRSQRRTTGGAAIALAVATMILAPGTGSAQEAPPDTLRFAWSSELGTLDPAIAYDTGTLVVEHAVWDTLVTYDGGTTLVPGLATAMPTISADGRTYTFDLRPDVPFVRHGEVLRTVTAADVVHSLNRILRPDMLPTPSPVGGTLFALIEGADAVLDGSAETASGIRAVDEDTVEITLTTADRTCSSTCSRCPSGASCPRSSRGWTRTPSRPTRWARARSMSSRTPQATAWSWHATPTTGVPMARASTGSRCD